MAAKIRRIDGVDYPTIPAREVQPGMILMRWRKLNSTVIEVRRHSTQVIIKMQNAAGEVEEEEFRGGTLLAASWPRGLGEQ